VLKVKIGKLALRVKLGGKEDMLECPLFRLDIIEGGCHTILPVQKFFRSEGRAVYENYAD
jgi:hypothetical protein